MSLIPFRTKPFLNERSELNELEAVSRLVYPESFIDWMEGNCLVGFRDPLFFESADFKGWWRYTLLLRRPRDCDFTEEGELLEASVADVVEERRSLFAENDVLRFAPFSKGFDQRFKLGLFSPEGYFGFDMWNNGSVHFLGEVDKIQLALDWDEFIERCIVRPFED